MNRKNNIITDIPLDDEKAFDKINADDGWLYSMIKEGYSSGFDEKECVRLMKELKKIVPSTFEQLTVKIALALSGSSLNLICEYIRRLNGGEVEHLHPLLKPLLQETCGLVLYQEQLMMIAGVAAGFSITQADKFRRSLGKRNADEFKTWRQEFFKNALPRLGDAAATGTVFDMLEESGSRVFSKAHATALAMGVYLDVFNKTYC